MRCIACDKNLNDFEATRKDASGEFIDLCNHCFRESEYDLDTDDRLDLIDEADILYNGKTVLDEAEW